jgi:hypothetical protein
METVRFEYQPTEYVIRIDRKQMSRKNFDKFVKWLEFEILVFEMDFDESVTKLHEEKMPYSWWENNKNKYIDNE